MEGLPALAVLLAGAAVYGAGVARRSRSVPWPRVTAFAAGWSALVVALLSPLDRLAGSAFWAHMVQHQLLMVVAAPLLVAGRPLRVSLAVLSRSGRRRLGRWRRSLGLDRWQRALARPSTGALVFALVLWAWHAPALYEAALRTPMVHVAEHASLLGAGTLFWWTLLRRHDGGGLAAFCLFVTAAHAGLLGVLLTLARTAWYPAQTGQTAWDLTPLEDQQLAGLVMWVPAGLAFVATALIVVAGWLREAARRVGLGTSDRLARDARDGR